MITTYEEYLQGPKSLTLETMQDLHRQMIEEITGDDDAEEIYDELIAQATRYASFRANWYVWDRETRMDKDDNRTSCHNSLIIKFNMLGRYLKMQGKAAAWRDALGYEEDDRYNRKTIGDFACYLVFVNSINAR